MALTKENQAKIESLSEMRRQLKAKVDDVKYSGVGGGHRRKLGTNIHPLSTLIYFNIPTQCPLYYNFQTPLTSPLSTPINTS